MRGGSVFWMVERKKSGSGAGALDWRLSRFRFPNIRSARGKGLSLGMGIGAKRLREARKIGGSVFLMDQEKD